jgi:hypothetical protein
MRPLCVCTALIIGAAGLFGDARPAGGQQLPPSTPSQFRSPPVPSGTGFYSRTYRAPGFSPVPAPPVYNAVSFYGRSYRAPGFSPVPATPSYNAVSFYGRGYLVPGFVPQRAGTVFPTAVAVGPSITVPEGFSSESAAGSYSYLNLYAPGSFPPNPSSGE